MDLSDIEAIIFDSDGVLVDSEIIHIAAERALLAEIGLDYDEDSYIQRFVGLSNKDFRDALAKDYAAKSLGLFPVDFKDRLRQRVWPQIERELKPIPGIRELVAQFDGPMAVASSAILPRLHRKLELTHLDGLFAPHIYSSDHVERGKPEPDLFLYAAQKLGVAPSRCMVIEDSQNGVRAGKRANMVTIGFLGGSHMRPEDGNRLRDAGADFVATSHAQIVSFLK